MNAKFRSLIGVLLLSIDRRQAIGDMACKRRDAHVVPP